MAELRIDGKLYKGDFELNIVRTGGGEVYDYETFTPEPAGTVELEATLGVRQMRRYQAVLGAGAVGGATAALQIVAERRREGRRCLWGWRRGWVQVGSAGDGPVMVTVEIPNVRWKGSK